MDDMPIQEGDRSEGFALEVIATPRHGGACQIISSMPVNASQTIVSTAGIFTNYPDGSVEKPKDVTPLPVRMLPI